MAMTTMSRPLSTFDRQPRRKKEQRTDIWSNLLRHTREAQARNRTHAVQHRELVVCGGSPDDQRQFVQSLARPPPSQPPSRNQEKRQQRPKGELRLSNKYAYGYGHVTLYSPPQQSGTGVQVPGAEAEEVARLEVHTLPDATDEYAGTLRGLLQKKKRQQQQQQQQQQPEGEDLDAEAIGDEAADMDNQRRPAVCVLLSWKQPWKFLDQLKKWLQLLAQALLPPGVLATDPLDVLKEAQLSFTVVVQHTETQEELFREAYREEDFDYISQCLRTVILPLHPLSALVYTTSTAPPQQPGSALSEPQKVIFNSAGLDLAALSPKRSHSSSGTERREELAVKHEFMDRMCIVIPAGWDSPAFIRTLSETFSPEDVVNGWLADLQPPPPPTEPQKSPQPEESKPASKQADGGAEVYESSPVLEDADDLSEAPLSPSKMSYSAIKAFEDRVLDPQAHKAIKIPHIEVVTKPDQKFLAEMREHLQQLEAQDRDRESKGQHAAVSHTGLSGSTSRIGGVPSGESTGALSELGDVSFNVGGVSYDTTTAEAAINALKRPQAGREDGPLSPATGTRTHTPKPRGPGSNRIDSSASKETPGSGMKSPDSKAPLDVDKLEEYFQSLLTKSGGSVSKTATPTKRGGAG